MDKLILIFKSIDWVFLSIILIGGRYWGRTYFTLFKRDALNFLAFATGFAIIYLGIQYFTVGITADKIVGLFITYLVATSFYELLAERLFELIEGAFPTKKKQTPLVEAVVKYEDATNEKVIKPDGQPVIPEPPTNKQ